MPSRKKGTGEGWRGLAWEAGSWIDGTGRVVDVKAEPGAWVVPDHTTLLRLAATPERTVAVYTSGAGEPVYADAPGHMRARSIHRLADADTIRAIAVIDTPDAIARACETVYATARATWAEISGTGQPTGPSSLLSPPLRGLARQPGHHRRQLDAVYPGRIELATHGHAGPVAVIDLRSAYGWAAVERPLPGRWVGEGASVPDAAIREGRAILTAEVEVPEDLRWGPLPVRTPTGEITYPCGRWVGTWAADELAAAQVSSGNRVGVRVLCGTWYDAWSPYDGVVERAYRIKQSTRDPVRKTAAKTAIVAVYGVLAAPDTSRVLVIRPSRILDGDDPVDGIAVMRSVYRPSAGWAPAAAAITARVRGRLYDALMAVPDAAYCATDSIHAPDGPELRGMVSDTRSIGSWSLEGVWPSATWHTAGTYLLPADAARGVEARERAAGIPRGLRASYLASGMAQVDVTGIRPSGTEARIAYQARLARSDGHRRPDPRRPGWTLPPRVEEVLPRGEHEDG